MSEQTTRGDATTPPEFRALLQARSGAVMPCGRTTASRRVTTPKGGLPGCVARVVLSACRSCPRAAGERDGVER